MKTRISLFIATLLMLGASPCLAYEPGTHAAMSDAAANQSWLDDRLQDWGIAGLQDPTLFPNSQFGAKVAVTRGAGPYPVNQSDTLINLIETGAALEDEGDRGACHFYDPVLGHTPQLDVLIGAADHSAPEWATGIGDLTQQPFSDQCMFQSTITILGQDITHTYGVPEPQDYSLYNAEKYFYNAFTSSKETDRQVALGNLFLSIGHVTHLLEDMAQPQHVRDDPHCDKGWLGCDVIAYNPSAYEEYVYNHTQALAEGQKPPNPEGGTLPVSLGSGQAPLVSEDSGGYVPSFSRNRDYWSDVGDFTTNGTGLAEFTNSNFLSIGTTDGFGGSPTAKYLSPVTSGSPLDIDATSYAEYLFITGEAPVAQCSASQPCVIRFFGNNVNDEYDGSRSFNDFAAQESMWDPFLTGGNFPMHYTLDNLTYQTAASFLVPRAVGYSAGLINHFFQGKLAVEWDENNPGDPSSETNLLLTNISAGALQNGDLGIYYDGIDGNRYRLNPQPTSVNLAAYCPPVVNGQPNPNCSFLPPDSMQVSIPLPLSPVPAKPNEYIFVYKGPINGNYDGYGTGNSDEHIAVNAFKPADPEYELMTWNYTASDGTWDATVRYDTQGHVLLELVDPHWTGNCSAPSTYTIITCSLLSDVAFYRHDVSGLDREYTARGDWGVHAVETVEAVATPPGVNSISVSNQSEFAKYTRDVNSAGTILPFTHPEYQDCFEAVNRIAVNRSNVFVAVNRYANGLSPTTNLQTQTACTFDTAHAGASMYIDVFDHSGVLQGMDELADEFYGDPQVPSSQSAGIRALAASDQGLCLVGLKTATNTGFAELRMLTGSGSGISIGPAQSLNDAGGNPLTNAVGCAATSDRYYVIEANPDETLGAPNNGISVLNSYDHNGNFKGSVVLQQILDDSANIDSRIRPFKIAASSNMIYVMTWQAPGLAARIYRYERTVNSNDMDTFSLAPVPQPTTRVPNPLPNPFIATGTQQSGSQAIAVDMYEALSLAGAQ